MFAKLLSLLTIELVKQLPGLALKLVSAVKAYLSRRKRIETNSQAANEVENANSSEDVRDAADNLP